MFFIIYLLTGKIKYELLSAQADSINRAKSFWPDIEMIWFLIKYERLLTNNII